MKYDIGALKLDLEELLLSIHLTKTDVKLVDLLIEKIKEYKNPLVCLSGGYDSQFMCLLLKQAGVNFTAVTYETMWGLNLVNSPDVAMARNFCKKHNIELQIVPLDFKAFLESELYVEYAIKYKSNSPQVAYHLYFLDQIDYSDRSIIMGGDIPNFNLDKDSGVVSVVVHSNMHDLKSVIVPYKDYCIQNNLNMCKDLLFYTPEIMYKSLENYVQMVKKYKVMMSSNQNCTGNYLKELYYNNILQENLETVLMSNTGFENIRLHHMSLSGDYDDFNNKYRVNLQFLLDKYYKDNYNLDSDWSAITTKSKGYEDVKVLLHEVQDFINEGNFELIEHYKLEF